MAKISIQKSKITFNKETNKFFGCDKDFPFDIEYELVNDRTQKSMKFKLQYSTGSEFDPNTEWVYANDDKTFSFIVGQDAALTNQRAQSYLSHKLNN